jgi:hypothetical protein
MQIAIVNVSSDCNRGACALTWASIYLLRSAFPEGSIALVPVHEQETPPDPPPFRHTMRRYPDIPILPPLFVGDGKSAWGLVWRLVRSLSRIRSLDRERRNPDPALEWIRNSDLVVSVGGVNFETLGGTLRHDGRFLTRPGRSTFPRRSSGPRSARSIRGWAASCIAGSPRRPRKSSRAIACRNPRRDDA